MEESPLEIVELLPTNPTQTGAICVARYVGKGPRRRLAVLRTWLGTGETQLALAADYCAAEQSWEAEQRRRGRKPAARVAEPSDPREAAAPT